MKKILFIVLGCGLLFVTGCEKKEEKKVDFSQYPFAGVTWTRDGENDIETIKFNTDGSFTYYCSCGNPVNDSDLCETYSYNEETNEIELDCFETTDETITTIKVIGVTDTTLELDFDGEVKKFEKENN